MVLCRDLNIFFSICPANCLHTSYKKVPPSPLIWDCTPLSHKSPIALVISAEVNPAWVFLTIVFSIFGPLLCYVTFRISCQALLTSETLFGIAWNMCIYLGRISIFLISPHSLSFSSPWLVLSSLPALSSKFQQDPSISAWNRCLSIQEESSPPNQSHNPSILLNTLESY